jgi:hypothetical protein
VFLEIAQIASKGCLRYVKPCLPTIGGWLADLVETKDS